jgi:nucleoid-associated protein YgaU/DNA-binding SARP family transcriptional activator
MIRLRLAALTRAAGSLAVLAGLVLGPPFALAMVVGWPFPTSVPNLDALERAARTGISDEVVVNVLAVIAWLAWAQITLAVVVEFVAVVRRRPAIRLPILPGLQTMAASLVSGIALVTTTLHAAPAAALRAPIPAVATMTGESHQAQPSPPNAADGPTGERQATDRPVVAPAAPITLTVQRHDSYWAIAERTLGDGMRWREIRDLNIGRTMADGQVIAPSSDELHPGWVLHLPADARTDPDPDGPPEAARISWPVRELTVEPGDNLWTIAEAQVADHLGRAPTNAEIHPYWRQLIAANDTRYVQPGNPDLILPGQRLVAPALGDDPVTNPPPPGAAPPTEASEAPIANEEPEATGGQSSPDGATSPSHEAPDAAPPAETSPPATAEPPSERTGEGSPGTSPALVAIGGMAATALAVGIKRALDRRRRRFSAAHPGQVSQTTREGERALHHAATAGADEQVIDDLHGVLAHLAAALADQGARCRPRLVQHSECHVDVFLDEPNPDPPGGWTANDDGSVWSTDATANAAVVGDDATHPNPLLVTLGQPDDGGQLYLDLEAEGLVTLTGDATTARGVALSFTTELALNPLAEALRIIVVGDLVEPPADRLDHLTVVDAWDGVLDELREWAEQSHHALAERGQPNAFLARTVDHEDDALVPVVVIATSEPPDAALSLLRDNWPSTVAVVALGDPTSPGTVIDCRPDLLTLRDAGICCTPQEIDDGTLAGIIRLLDTADAAAPEAPEPTPSPNGAEPIGEATPAALDPAGNGAGSMLAGGPREPEYDVLVRLLGDIRIEGGHHLRPKPTAVVAYVALHRQVTIERLEDACWAATGTTSRRKRLKDTMTECRAALGSHLFPAASRGRYTAGPRLLADTDLFEWHVARAADLPPAKAVETYRSALDLVTGRIFSYPSNAGASYGWIDVENLVSRWELKIAGVAQQCAEIYLDLDQPEEAVAVALHALDALPLNAALTETLMRAHAANSDPASVEEAYRAHTAALNNLGLDDPDDTTTQLRLALSGDTV